MMVAREKKKKARQTSTVSKPNGKGNGDHRYQTVKRFILQGIARGKWRAGEQLPTEPQLVKTLEISRMTVHRALRELTAAGVLARRRGAGTFIAPPKPRSELVRVNDIAADIRSRQLEHAARVIELDSRRADAEIARALGVRQGARVFHSVIVHYASGTAVQLEERFVNPQLAPDYLKQDFTAITPNEYLMRATPITEIENVIHAVKPDRALCRLLAIDGDEPCLMLLRRTWTGPQVATSSKFVYPGSRFSLGSRFATDRLSDHS